MRLCSIVAVRIQRTTTARFVFAYIFAHFPDGAQYGSLFDGYVKGFFYENLPTRQILSADQHLLEVKYDELLPDYLKDALQLGNLQQSTFSKYYLCRKYSMGGKL